MTKQAVAAVFSSSVMAKSTACFVSFTIIGCTYRVLEWKTKSNREGAEIIHSNSLFRIERIYFLQYYIADQDVCHLLLPKMKVERHPLLLFRARLRETG